MSGLWRSIVISALVLPLIAPQPASAQNLLVGGHLGGIWFLDDGGSIDHAAAGAGARYFITSRIAVGPEVLYSRRSGNDREWFLLGTLTGDLGPTRWAKMMPYGVISGGAIHYDVVQYGNASSGFSRTLDFGAGLRFQIGEKWFVAPEYRFGGLLIEGAYQRFGVSLGLRP